MTKEVRIALLMDMSWAYTRGLMRGIMDVAQSRRWLVRMLSDQVKPVRHALREWPPHGIIGLFTSPELLAAAQQRRCKIVNVANFFDSRVPRVGIDEAAIGAMAAEYFIGRSFTNFAFSGDANANFSLQRRDAFVSTLKARGFECDCCILPGVIHDHFRPWLKSLPKPVALLASTDNSGWGVGEMCRSMGIRIPEELALLGVDNDEFECELASPPLSSVANRAREIGRAAAGMLERLLRGGRQPAKPLLLKPAGIVTRQSTDVLAIADPELAAALSFIRRNCHRPLAVKEILREVPLSRRTLELKFRRTLRRSPHDEIRRVQLERARLLLLTTNMTIAEIGRESGFGGLIQFSSAFAKATGLSPTRFRASEAR
jgi:LacI family transcriptional regulator